MSERVSALKRFHDTMSFGGRDERIRRHDEAAGLYRALGPHEARELAAFAMGEPAPDGDRYRWHEEILLCLACLRPGSLDGLHDALLDRGIIHPPVIWHGAGPDVASRIVAMLPGRAPDLRGLDRLLLALAWIGDEAVQDAFRRWRDDPPQWADTSRRPPHRFAEEAGWELTAEGTRRDLFSRLCHPLVEPNDRAADAGIARIVAGHEGSCRWCGRALTALLDLDLAWPGLSALGLDGRLLRIAACEYCSCYGPVFTAVGPDGESSCHEANRRPEYPRKVAPDWPRMAQGRLVFGREPRLGSKRRTGRCRASASRRSAGTRPGSRTPFIPAVRDAGVRCRSSPRSRTTTSTRSPTVFTTCSSAGNAAWRRPIVSNRDRAGGFGWPSPAPVPTPSSCRWRRSSGWAAGNGGGLS